MSFVDKYQNVESIQCQDCCYRWYPLKYLDYDNLFFFYLFWLNQHRSQLWYDSGRIEESKIILNRTKKYVNEDILGHTTFDSFMFAIKNRKLNKIWNKIPIQRLTEGNQRKKNPSPGPFPFDLEVSALWYT